MRLFEAARWAPSSFNTQQWRALYARRGTEHWQTFFDLLVDANKTGQRTQPFLSSSFHEGISIIITSRQSRIHTTAEQRGRISRCKAFNRVWSCMGCKDSITNARAKSLRFLTNSKSKRWPPSADPDRKNSSLKNYRHARARMTDGKFRKASLRGRLSLNSFGLTTDQPALGRSPHAWRCSDPKQRSDCACRGERGANHHHPAKSGHERFIDCATD